MNPDHFKGPRPDNVKNPRLERFWGKGGGREKWRRPAEHEADVDALGASRHTVDYDPLTKSQIALHSQLRGRV